MAKLLAGGGVLGGMADFQNLPKLPLSQNCACIERPYVNCPARHCSALFTTTGCTAPKQLAQTVFPFSALLSDLRCTQIG
jgi:hypothetical protein